MVGISGIPVGFAVEGLEFEALKGPSRHSERFHAADLDLPVDDGAAERQQRQSRLVPRLEGQAANQLKELLVIEYRAVEWDVPDFSRGGGFCFHMVRMVGEVHASGADV